MPILSVHKHRSANVFCDCPDHIEARKAGVKAHKTSVAMLEAAKAGDWDKVDALLPELEKFNAIARQCDE